MRKYGLALMLLIVAIVVFMKFFRNDDKPKPTAPKAQPVAVSKYSPAFTNSVNATLAAYYALSESFVNWDSAGIRANATALQSALDAIAFNELKKDTIIHQTATSYLEAFHGDLQTISSPADITTRRRSFHSFTQNFYDLLRTIRYDAATIYMQECPMAFNDTESANWLSGTAAVRNPYLGLHHPKYKGAMIDCGETKDSLKIGR
jgi:hypothetical protein